jgi:hypothetical protein
MRNYGISAIKLNDSGPHVAEVFLHRCRREPDSGAIGLQYGKAVKCADVAELLARGDNVCVVRMSAAACDFETVEPVRLEQGLQSYRGDGIATTALADLPKYD